MARARIERAAADGVRTSLLSADASVRAVGYDADHAQAVVNKDGSITLRMPSTIGEISFRNIRVGNAASGPSFGSISLQNIDLRGTYVYKKE